MREMLIALILMLLFLFAGERIRRFLICAPKRCRFPAASFCFDRHSHDFSVRRDQHQRPARRRRAVRCRWRSAGRRALAARHPDAAFTPVSQSDDAPVGALLIAGRHGSDSADVRPVPAPAGDKGVNALERLMGLILIMLATQMFPDGIRVYLKL